MAAANFKTGNLTAFIDWNKVQATGRTIETFAIPALAEKWSSFGWNVQTINGHDVAAVCAAVEAAKTVKDKPSLIILDTVKGKCFSFAEGNAAYHNGVLTEETRAQALQELDAIKARLG